MPTTKTMKEFAFTAEEVKELLGKKIEAEIGHCAFNIRDVDPQFTKKTQGFGSNEIETEFFAGIKVTVIVS